MAELNATNISGTLLITNTLYGQDGIFVSLTSSLYGTASYAVTASYAENGGGGASLGTGSTYPFTASYSVSASRAVSALSSAFATSASYAITAVQSAYSTFNLQPQSPGGSSGGELRWVGSTTNNGDWYFDLVNKDMRMLYVTGSDIRQEIRLIPDVTNFGAWFYLPIRATYGVTGSLQGNATTATSASIADKVSTHVEKGVISGSLFDGDPKTYAIIYASPFPTDIYVLSVVGTEARTWTYVPSTTGSIISTNSNQSLGGFVSWRAEEI